MKNITDKLQSRGAQSLSDAELVGLILAEHPQDDNAKTMAEEVLKQSADSLLRVVETVKNTLDLESIMGVG